MVTYKDMIISHIVLESYNKIVEITKNQNQNHLDYLKTRKQIIVCMTWCDMLYPTTISKYNLFKLVCKFPKMCIAVPLDRDLPLTNLVIKASNYPDRNVH